MKQLTYKNKAEFLADEELQNDGIYAIANATNSFYVCDLTGTDFYNLVSQGIAIDTLSLSEEQYDEFIESKHIQGDFFSDYVLADDKFIEIVKQKALNIVFTT